jgi:hypothetical protein
VDFSSSSPSAVSLFSGGGQGMVAALVHLACVVASFFGVDQNLRELHRRI